MHQQSIHAAIERNFIFVHELNEGIKLVIFMEVSQQLNHLEIKVDRWNGCLFNTIKRHLLFDSDEEVS